MDWMDELLKQLPYEPPSRGLDQSIKARLTAYRFRRRWRKRVSLAAVSLAGIVGGRLAVLGLFPFAKRFPHPSLDGMQAALFYFIRSPMEASVDLGQWLTSWQSDLLISVDFASILSLIVVSLISLYGMLLLLNGRETERRVLS
jgi:hypothetical protein